MTEDVAVPVDGELVAAEGRLTVLPQCQGCRASFYAVADAWLAAGFPLEAAEILEAMRQAQCFRLVAAAEASGAGLPCGPS